MKSKIKLRQRAALLLLLLSTLSLQPSTTVAQGTIFTYQGRLNDGGQPANGTNYGMLFYLYDAPTGGSLVGNLGIVSVTVSNGLFTVPLNFDHVFDGNPRWLEINVQKNGGSYSTLTPRQPLRPTPYAITAGRVVSGGLSSGAYTNAVTFNHAANSFTGNGGGLTNVTAATLGGLSAGQFWKLGGNAGTTPGTQFLGTTDNSPLEFKVNGARGLRLEPNPNTPNVIGGSSANEVTNGIYGAVIAGGGSSFYPNRVGAIYASVLGGAGNTASGNYAVVAGDHATASGYAATALGYYTAAGGFGSQAGGTAAKANHEGTFVWGDHTFTDFASTANNQFLIRAAGGVGINTNDPNGAALAVNGNVTVNGTIGTAGNQALEFKVNGIRALRLEPTSRLDTVNVIGGSPRNFVGAGVRGATIGGGGTGNYGAVGGSPHTNRVEADYGTVSGGLKNAIEASAIIATIGGGIENTIENFAFNATIGGGSRNRIKANATYATIGGGGDNTIQPNGWSATIPGGELNSATNYCFAAGRRAKANHTGAFVWADSTFADFASTANDQFLIRASGGVGVGTPNPQGSLHVYSANNPTVVRIQSAGTPGFGRIEFVSNPQSDVNEWRPGYIQSTDNGGFTGGLAFFVNGTGGGSKFGSSEVMRVVNGAVGIGTTTPVSALQVIGTVTATAFNPPSDRNLKENFTPVSPSDVLAKVVALPISSWNFKGDSATPHVGPMAQDFHAAFGLGTDDKHIATVAADGVALAAIQGLNQKLEEQRAENQELKQRLEALEKIIRNQNPN